MMERVAGYSVIGEFPVPVAVTYDDRHLKGRSLFSLTLLEVPVHHRLALLLWKCGKPEHS